MSCNILLSKRSKIFGTLQDGVYLKIYISFVIDINFLSIEQTPNEKLDFLILCQAFLELQFCVMPVSLSFPICIHKLYLILTISKIKK